MIPLLDMITEILVIGGGIAGCEAALKAASLGVHVTLIEMKPNYYTPAHYSPLISELVCSNSFRSIELINTIGLLKAEMGILGSAIITAASKTTVKADKALAVDRELFALLLDQTISSNSLINIHHQQIDQLPLKKITIIATGPLTTKKLTNNLLQLTGSKGLHFYDAIAPIVTTESVNMNKAFWANRHNKNNIGDYLNCPLNRKEWDLFYQNLINAEQVPLSDFESHHFFEGCLPIEILAARGKQTLLWGPMKPIGIKNPNSGYQPQAIVQLRKEDIEGRLLNLVGFQTKLTYSAQKRVFRLIPGLEQAKFVRFGSIHRNTY